MTSPGLLYIVSSGRSGSTLLELLAATHPRIRTLGELQTAGHLLRSTERSCGCGATMADCPVWNTVAQLGVLEDAAVPLTLVRERSGAGRVLRARWLPEVLRPSEGPRAARHAAGYTQGTAALLDSVAGAEHDLGAAPVAWYVDSSKDLYRLHLLAAGRGDLPLRAVLLVRDPRGFVHATARTGARRTVRMSVRWVLQQFLARRVLRWFPAADRLVVRYEDLATDPEHELNELATLLGVPADEFDPEGVRSVRDHAVAGNQMRWSNEPVRLDDRWRTTSPRWQQLLVWTMCAPVARSFGYRWRAR